MALSDNIVTTPDIGNVDDGFVTITLPWEVRYLQQTFNKVYVNTNSFLFFTNDTAAPLATLNGDWGSSVNLPYVNFNYPNYANFPGSSWRQLRICAIDNTMQRIMHGMDIDSGGNRTYRIRYEGTNTLGYPPGTFSYPGIGASNICWEVLFVETNMNSIEVYIDTMPLELSTRNYDASIGFILANTSGLTLNTTGTFVPSTNSAYRITSSDGTGVNTYVSATSINAARSSLFHISGTAGSMLMGDPQLPVYSGLGDVCYTPDSWGSQVTFHSNRKYLKINGVITTTAGTFAAVDVDYRTWSDPSSKGC